jgi:hypothetical protein
MLVASSLSFAAPAGNGAGSAGRVEVVEPCFVPGVTA